VPAPASKSRVETNRKLAVLPQRLVRHICSGLHVTKSDQSGRRRPKAAGVDIKRTKFVFEVDVEPFATRRGGLSHGDFDKPSRDSSTPMGTSGLGVQEKRMCSSVPGHVDEPDQRAVGRPGGHPAQTVRPNAIPPTNLGTTSMGGNELDHLLVVQFSTPLVRVLSCHLTRVPRIPVGLSDNVTLPGQPDQNGGVKAALLDWRGTLVADFPDSWWLERAFRAIDRMPDVGEVDEFVGSPDAEEAIDSTFRIVALRAEDSLPERRTILTGAPGGRR
jgi:hypothetical protein